MSYQNDVVVDRWLLTLFSRIYDDDSVFSTSTMQRAMCLKRGGHEPRRTVKIWYIAEWKNFFSVFLPSSRAFQVQVNTTHSNCQSFWHLALRCLIQ